MGSKNVFELRGSCATFLNILGTLFFPWFFYGLKWKFSLNLLQGTHRNQFFGSKRPLFDFFKKKSPFQGVTMKNRKMGQNHTFWERNVSKLGQNVVCTYFVWWKSSKQEKVSGNTVFWFFSVFWSVFNLTGSVRPKSGFCTWFRKFGANNEVWDDKKAMLNGKTQAKVKNGIFFGKKCRFWNLAKNPETNTTLL